MAGSIETVHPYVEAAFRSAWQAVVKARTVSSAITVTATGYTRVVGSWIDDGFDPGDEFSILGAGAAQNNGTKYIQQLDTLNLVLRNPDTVPEAAGAAMTITAACPAGRKLEGFKYEPTVGVPYVREKHQRGVIRTTSLRSPFVRVRTEGVYWLSLLYPAGLGKTGADRLAAKLVASIKPTVQLVYAGQVVTVLRVVPKDLIEETEWITLPLTWQYRADADVTP